ncbi:hypothetical protein BHE74_00051299 [Ensete ventricosum]|nr:hypothetical protein BHE74_00051299 [Ensete ventricosum]
MEAGLLLEPVGDGLADRLQNQRPKLHHRQDHPSSPHSTRPSRALGEFRRNQAKKRRGTGRFPPDIWGSRLELAAERRRPGRESPTSVSLTHIARKGCHKTTVSHNLAPGRGCVSHKTLMS